MTSNVPELVKGTSEATTDLSTAEINAGVHVVAVDPTQVRRPWRSTARTVFQAFVMLCATAPAIYTAATEQSPELATGYAAGGLAIAGAVTRVMALPRVERFLRRFLPFLAAAPEPRG